MVEEPGHSVAEKETNERADGRLTLGVVAALSVVLTVVVLVMAYLFFHRSPNAAIEIHPPPPTPTIRPTATLSPLSVYVTGAVNRPGVVQVLPGARVKDAVAAAGGASADADLGRYNLAAPLFDGQHLQVPITGEALHPIELNGDGAMPPQPVNINTATVDELITLPGVGPATAEQIVTHRQEYGLFTHIEEIMDVPGVAESKFDGFKEMITVGP